MKVTIGPYTDDESSRLVSVELDAFDSWSVDSTLALIIAPLLQQLRNTQQGAPYVDDSDVPEYLRSNEVDEDGLGITHFEKWNWVLDEMIWVFSNYNTLTYDVIGDTMMQAKIDNALRLFGKYYQALWD